MNANTNTSNDTTVLNNKETKMKLETNLNEIFGNWTRMAGTEGTYEYVVIAATELGRVGVRDFTKSGSPLRIRVEPAGRFMLYHANSLPMQGWKKPGDGGQWRYSIVLPAGEQALEGMKQALRAIQAGRRETLVSLGASQEVKAFVAAEAADEERIRQENLAMEKRNETLRAMLKYPVIGRMQLEANSLSFVAADKREEAARLLAEAEQAELEAARLIAAAERLQAALDEAESLGFPLNPPFVAPVEEDDDDDLWTEDDNINAGFADGEPVKADPAARRAELMLKTSNELNRLLKEVRGTGLFGANKAFLVEEILRAEGYDI